MFDYLTDEVAADIVAARIKLLMTKPFFGNIATQLIAVEAPWCKTGATDGKHLFYNREFIKSLSRPNLLFFIVHEIYHVILDHLGRRGNRDQDILNMAQDYVINAAIVHEKIGEMPDCGLLDPKFTHNMSSDEVYDILKKNSVTIKMPMDEHLELGNDSSDGDGDREGNVSQKDVSITVMGKDGPPKLSEEELQEIRNRLRATIIATAQAYGAGSIPAGLQRLVGDFLEPKLDWRTLLDVFIRSSRKNDYTFQRMSRRASWEPGSAIFPAQDNAKKTKVHLRIDASGSTTTDMVTDFLSEIKGIMDSWDDYELNIGSFDTEIYNVVTMTPENRSDIYTYEVSGNGGTDFNAIFAELKESGQVPDRLVILTDGMPNSGWGDENYCDTLFIIHSTGVTAPWGTSVAYEQRDGKS